MVCFTYHDLQFYLFSPKWPNLIILYRIDKRHCQMYHIFLIHWLAVKGWFRVLTGMNRATIAMDVQASLWLFIVCWPKSPSGPYPRGIAASNGSFIFHFCRNRYQYYWGIQGSFLLLRLNDKRILQWTQQEVEGSCNRVWKEADRAGELWTLVVWGRMMREKRKKVSMFSHGDQQAALS